MLPALPGAATRPEREGIRSADVLWDRVVRRVVAWDTYLAYASAGEYEPNWVEFCPTLALIPRNSPPAGFSGPKCLLKFPQLLKIN